MDLEKLFRQAWNIGSFDQIELLTLVILEVILDIIVDMAEVELRVSRNWRVGVLDVRMESTVT